MATRVRKGFPNKRPKTAAEMYGMSESDDAPDPTRGPGGHKLGDPVHVVGHGPGTVTGHDGDMVHANVGGNRVTVHRNAAKLTPSEDDAPAGKRPFPGSPKKSLFSKRDGAFFKVDKTHGIAYGWAIISTVNGEPYYDTQGDHIPMDACIRAAEHFMKNSRAGDEQHDERRAGDVPFCFPVTVELAKSLFGANMNQEGLVIGFKPYDKKLLAKIERGERRGFSIGGTLSSFVSKAAGAIGRAVFAKGFSEEYADTQGSRRIFEEFQIDFISAVDWPAQEGALVTIVKSLDGTDSREPVLWMRKDIMPPKKQPQIPGQQPGQPNLPPNPNMVGQAAPMSPMQSGGVSNGPMSPMGNMSMAAPPMPMGPGGQPIAQQPKLTGDSDGHQHAISMTEVGEDGVGYTGFGISTNGVSHRHAFVVNPDGTTTIATNDGHTHNADGTPGDAGGELDENGDPIEPELDENGNPVDNAAEDALDGGADDASETPDDGSTVDDSSGPTFGASDQKPVVDPMKKPKPGASPFAPQKRASRNTCQNGEPGLASVTKEHAMDPQTQIASLKKQLADAQAFAELSDAQKAHHRTLSKRDQDAYLAKSVAERDSDVAKARDADPVAYKCDDGTEIRKSQGELIEKMARRNDENSAALKKQIDRADKLEFEKRATSEMKHYPDAAAGGRAWLLKAIDAQPGTEDEKKLAKAAIAAGDKALSKSFRRYGKSADVAADEVNDDPEAKLEALAKQHAKDNKISYAKAYAEVLDTEEGSELYTEISDAGPSASVDEYEDDDDDGDDFEEVVEDVK